MTSTHIDEDDGVSLTFEQEQKKRAEFSKWLSDFTDRAFDWFGRQIAWSFGRKYFWDLPPREQKAFFAKYPPILMGGTIPPPSLLPPDPMAQPVVDPQTGAAMMPPPKRAPGVPQWDVIATETPREYDRYVRRYGELLKDEMARPENLPLIMAVEMFLSMQPQTVPMFGQEALV